MTEKQEQPDQKQTTGGFGLSHLIITGYGEKKEYPLNQEEIKIGRHEDNDLRLQDPAVSKLHCVIRHKDGRYILEDKDSKNGTFVNGNRKRSHVIRPHDRITIGRARIKPVFGTRTKDEELDLEIEGEGEEDADLEEEEPEPLDTEEAKKIFKQASEHQASAESSVISIDRSSKSSSSSSPKRNVLMRVLKAPNYWKISVKVILGVSGGLILLLLSAVVLSKEVNLLKYGEHAHWLNFDLDHSYRGVFDFAYNWWAWIFVILFISAYEYWLWK